jgi:hypothetical protein
MFYKLNKTTNKMYLDYVNDIPYRFCTIKDFPNVSKKEFKESMLEHTLCSQDSNYNYSLYGYWTDDRVSILSIQVLECGGIGYKGFNNKHISPQNKTCKSKEEIKNYIRNYGPNLNIFYNSHKFQLSNYKYPYEKFIKSDYKYVIDNLNKVTDFFISEDFIRTDVGFLFEEHEKQIYYDLKEKNTDIRMIGDNNVLLTFDIYSSNYKESYHRSYLKLFEIIGLIGGMLRILTIIFDPLNSILSKISITKEIINQLFIIDDKKDYLNKEDLRNTENKNNPLNPKNNFRFNPIEAFEKSNNNLILESKIRNKKIIKKNNFIRHDENNIEINNIENNFGINNIDNINGIREENEGNEIRNLKLTMEKKLEFINKNFKKERINLKCKDYFRAFFNLKNKTFLKTDYLIYFLGSKMLTNYLEFKNLIKKINEVEIIKSIFFKDHQISLINYLNKPNIKNLSILDFKRYNNNDYQEIVKKDNDLINSQLDRIDLNSRSDLSFFNLLKNHI